MSTTVQTIMIGLVVLTATAVIRLVRRRRLRGKYVLLWLLTCLAMVPPAVAPNRVDDLVSDLGVSYPPTAYLLAAVMFLFGVAIHMSWELSRLDERTRSLAEELALLRGDLVYGLPLPASGITKDTTDGPSEPLHSGVGASGVRSDRTPGNKGPG
jgi:hypothetical protein